MVFNGNISALLVKETRVPGENNRHAASY